jgi:tetratricopeptide (TPR) repeat protein
MQLQQTFGSTSVPLGMNPPPGLFAGQWRATPSKRAAGPVSASTRNRAEPDEAETVQLELEDVVARLKRGERLTPRHAGAAFDLGWAYRTLGRWADAVDAFSKAIGFFKQTEGKYRDHNLAAAYYMRGYAYASLASKQEGEEARQNFEKAEQDYLEALRLKKDYMIVYCYLGVLYGTQGRFDEAQRALKKAIRLKPRYAGAHHDLGAIYLQSGRPKLALREFEKAIEYQPKNLLALRHLAGAYYNAERWEDARRVLLRILKLVPEDQEALYKLGGVYLHFGNFQKAEESLLKVLKIDPDDVTAHSNLGIVYFKAGRLGDAAVALNRALELGRPEAGGVRTGLSAVQQAMLEVVANAYLSMLSYGVEPDADSLAAQVANVREAVSAGENSLLEPPGVYFPTQLMDALAPIVQLLDEEKRFRLAAKLFERRLLSSGKASRLIGMDRVPFLMNLHRVGVAVFDLTPEELEQEARYANAG